MTIQDSSGRAIRDPDDFARVFELLSAIDVARFDRQSPARRNFSYQLASLGLPKDRIADVFEALTGRTLSIDERIDLHRTEATAASLVTHALLEYPFRWALLRRICIHFRPRVIFLLHIPKTGGQSLVGNLFDADYPVWSVDRSTHPDWIFELLPVLARKIQKTGTIVVHGHIYWSHIQDLFTFGERDMPLCVIREPLQIHLSNARYIVKTLRERRADQVIDDVLAQFGEHASPDVRFDQAVRSLLLSAEYASVYSNVIARYLLGEMDPSKFDPPSVVAALPRRLRFVRLDDLNAFIEETFDIEQPRIFNAGSSHRGGSGSVDADEIRHLVGYDEQLYEALLASRTLSLFRPARP